MKNRVVGAGIVLLLICSWCGCGSDNPLGRVAVSGTVTLNGAPLEKGSITLLPAQAGPVLTGTSINNGAFDIPTEKGPVPGEYFVKINAIDLSGEASSGQPAVGRGAHDPLPSLIPPDWSQGRTHKVTVTAEGSNQFTFEITK